MGLRLEKSWKLGKTGKILLLTLVLILVVGGYFTFFFYPKSETKQSGSVSIVEPKKEYPIYYVIQDNKARVLLYDLVEKKNREILSADVSNEWSFGVDYSEKRNELVYGDIAGIWTMNLESKEKKQVVANRVAAQVKEGTNGQEPTGFSAPEYSDDGEHIVYRGTFEDGPGAVSYIANPDGQGSQKLKNFYSRIGMRWTNDGRYVSATGMDGTAFSVAKKDPITQSTTFDTSEKTGSLISWDFNKDQSKIIFSSIVYSSDNKEVPKMWTVDLDGKNLTEINQNAGQVSELIYDQYSEKVIYSKNDLTKKIGLGLFSFAAGESAQEFLKDGDNILTPIALNKEYLAYSSQPILENGSTIKELNLMNLADKSVYSIGEAKNIGFVGWIFSGKYNELAEVPRVTPTDKEKEAYSNSLKTHGYLSQSFYDYCWDYDCQSPTYPYTKKTTGGGIPEIVELSVSPIKLTGEITLPVVYLYQDKPFTDEQIDVVHNSSKDSFKKLENWLNAQASGKAKITIENKGKVQLKDECVKYFGTNKAYDPNCVRSEIVKSVDSLKDSPAIITVGMNISAYVSNRVQFVDGNKSLFMLSFNVADTIKNYQESTYLTDAQKIDSIDKIFTEGNYMGLDYSVKQLMTLFGAKDKNATYKQPKDSNSPGCFVDQPNDVMCDSMLSVQTTYKSYSEKVFGEITKKELGWFDADGDGVNEAADRCPFDKANKC